jgi:hypothetical protein
MQRNGTRRPRVVNKEFDAEAAAISSPSPRYWQAMRGLVVTDNTNRNIN